jgi:signal transduction histidine kinase
MIPSFSRRIVLAFALLLFGFGVAAAVLAHRVAVAHEQEALQRVSYGLARHIVEHWPEMAQPARGPLDRGALDALLLMLMSVNPAIDVYVLDHAGRIRAYLGDPQAVREAQVAIGPVRDFLAGARLPIFGSDPKSPAVPKVFSAAMFPAAAAASSPAGYLYIVLNGEARMLAEARASPNRLWESIGVGVGVGLVLTLLVGWLTLRYLTEPLRSAAARMQSFNIPGEALVPAAGGEAAQPDELAAIDRAFSTMAQRIESQVRDLAARQAEHREIIANVAHDLRTPLTALHGYLETLQQRGVGISAAEHERYVVAALAQSDKVRNLTQQLFELARLQSSDVSVQRERFRIDELVQDTVQKFALSALPAPVTLHGTAPGRIEVEGDLQLIDRALTNLIDNAIRHGRGNEPVRVSVARNAGSVDILVEDDGPGLPAALAQLLDSHQPLRERPPERPGGGFGGLGLAIAQRIAWLHGGRLHTLPAAHGGARLCLALPLADIDPAA